MKPIFRSYLTEINLGATLPGNGATINFQDYPVLRGVVLLGVAAVDNNLLSVSPYNKPVVTIINGLTITLLNAQSQEILKDFPVFDCVPSYNGGIYREFQPFELNLVKSYITVRNNAGLLANQSVCFNLFYLLPHEFAKIFKAKNTSGRNVATR